MRGIIQFKTTLAIVIKIVYCITVERNRDVSDSGCHQNRIDIHKLDANSYLIFDKTVKTSQQRKDILFIK